MTPRITFAVLAYKQSAFIDDALASALSQECEPLEILLSDDCSPDDTFERMQRAAANYRGPHSIVPRRNPSNLGIGQHFNAVMQAARGELVVIMAGDDISLPGRVAKTVAAWDATRGRVDLIASHLIDMTHDGRDVGVLEVDDLSQWRSIDAWVRQRPYIVGAAHAFTRRLFERFGPVAQGVAHEDQVNLLRAICSGGAVTLKEPLVRYRRGGVSGRMSDFSAQAFIARTRRQNTEHVALHQQWLNDARLVGCESTVEHGIRREFDRELFLEALLAASTLRERMAVASRWHSVAFHRRLRKLAYVSVPGLAARMRYWQMESKRRRGDAR